MCWLGLFAPGILLLYGLMPWWVQFRQFDIYRRSVACCTECVKHPGFFRTLLMHCSVCRALPGVNAAAVGLIVAAVFQLGLKVRANSPFPDATVCIGKWSHLPRPSCMPHCTYARSITWPSAHEAMLCSY